MRPLPSSLSGRMARWSPYGRRNWLLPRPCGPSRVGISARARSSVRRSKQPPLLNRRAPHRPQGLLLWEADAPDHVEDVSAFVDVKLHALEAHESQFESTMKAVDDDQLDAFRQRVRTRLAGLGAPHGVAAAELFKLITP